MSCSNFWFGIFFIALAAVIGYFGTRMATDNWGYWKPMSNATNKDMLEKNNAAIVSYKVASSLPGVSSFNFEKEGRLWFLIENKETRKVRAYVTIHFISDDKKIPISDHYGGSWAWNLNALEGIRAPGLYAPPEIMEEVKNKKRIKVQIDVVIKDEKDNLIENKLPRTYIYGYDVKEWYLEP